MSVRSYLCVIAFSGSLLFAAGPKQGREYDAWPSGMGRLQILEAKAGDAWLSCNGKRLHRFPTSGFLRASYRPDGRDGDELFLIQLNAADSVWFHFLEVKKDRSYSLSPMFGNGGEYPTITVKGESVEVQFVALDLPRGKVEAQTWRYESHSLKKL